MFFSYTLLTKGGKYAHLWEAANQNMQKRAGLWVFTKKSSASANRKFMAINIADIVDELITEKLALRLSATLMSGVVRVYAMKENQLEKKALEASNEMRKKMINAGANVTLPKDRQTAAHDKITMSDDAGDTLMLLTSQPDDLEDLANLDMGEWTVTNDPAARVSVSDVQKSAVTLPDRDDGMLGDGDFEIGFGDEFGLMDNNDADGFDDMQESGGFQLDDLETQQQLDEPDAGMIEFTMDDRPDDVPLHKDELDKENITDSSSQRLSSASKSTASSVSDSVFIQARMSTSSTKKRRRSSNEPTIDEVTQLSSDAMRLNLTSTEDILAVYRRASVETFTQRKRRNDRDFNTPLFPPQNEDFAEMRLAMIQTSLEPEDVEEPEKPRSQEEEDDLELFGHDQSDGKRKSSFAGRRASGAPKFEHTDEGELDESAIDANGTSNFGDDFGDMGGDNFFDESVQIGVQSPERDDVDDPNGVYTAQGSPVSSFPSMYSETDPSQSSQSQTYSQAGLALVEAIDDGGMFFNQLAEKLGGRKPARRLDAAKTFHNVLVMASKGRLTVEQTAAYGPIHVALPAAA